MEKGVFTISIDYEFGWGKAERHMKSEEQETIRNETYIVRRLLALFEEFDIAATWAVVSHLLERSCSFAETLPHPEYPRPIASGRDWFFQHPLEGSVRDSLWFDADALIPQIAASPVRHEIGSHSYAHIAYGAADANPAAVRVDIAKAKSCHTERSIAFQAFVFPWNSEGFFDLLYEKGITCYRGTTARWYHKLPGLFKRAGHLFDYVLPFAPPASVPSVHVSGLVNIPDSMLLLRREGIRRWTPPYMLKKKALRGLERAVSHKSIFHLWFHPSNFSFRTEEQFAILEAILRGAQRLKARGLLEVLTMSQIHTMIRQHDG